MEDLDNLFVHSIPIDDETIRQAHLFTSLPVRKNKYSDKADEGAQKALDLWLAHTRDDDRKKSFKLSAFSGPKGLPERMAMLVFLSDFGTIYDDFCEPLQSKDGIGHYEEFERSWNIQPREGSPKLAAEASLFDALSPTLLELVKMDQQSGVHFIEAYREWINNVGRVPEMSNYKEYITYRIKDIGIWAYWAMHEFTMGLNFTAQDRELIKPITDTATEYLTLSQDYWSWDKEYHAWRNKSVEPLNVVNFLSKSKGISFQDAKEETITMILCLEEKYQKQKSEFYTQYSGSSVSLRVWVETLGITMGGYNYWSASCPRYHGWKHTQQVCRLDSLGGTLSDSSVISYIDTPSSQSRSTKPLNEERVFEMKLNKDRQRGDKKQEAATTTHDAAVREILWGHGTMKPFSDKPKDLALTAPYRYISNLPSKGFRSMLIMALNHWLKAPKSSVDKIKNIVELLHNASLLIDDVQDNSMLRRGRAAAHAIFGVPQTINSGLFMFSKVIEQTRQLEDAKSIDIVLENLERLYLGQSWDLYWKYNLLCPSKEEYLGMVDSKTGAMLRLLMQLLQAESSSSPVIMLDGLILLLGRYFQIRDDYMNLQSKDYSIQKGFCEDLDEGKFSYPIVCLLNQAPQYRDFITGIFRQIPVTIGNAAGLPHATKLNILELLRASGSLRLTLDCLRDLEADIEKEITYLEAITGEKNAALRLVMAMLSTKELIC